jgi:hypothetical protein
MHIFVYVTERTVFLYFILFFIRLVADEVVCNNVGIQHLNLRLLLVTDLRTVTLVKL